MALPPQEEGLIAKEYFLPDIKVWNRLKGVGREIRGDILEREEKETS